jgi:hypothetical protein
MVHGSLLLTVAPLQLVPAGQIKAVRIIESIDNDPKRKGCRSCLMAAGTARREGGEGEEGDKNRGRERGRGGKVVESRGEENAYVCGRCGSSFDTPQSLRDHEENHVEEGDEEVEEEWEHTPGEPEEEVPSLGGDTMGNVV